MAAFDFETKGLHGVVVYGTAQWELEACGERSRVRTVHTEDDMLALMLGANRKAMRWYAHNAGYDLYYLIDAARRLQTSGEMGEIEPQLRGDRSIYRVKFYPTKGPPLDVYDSMAIATNGGQGIALAKFAEKFSTVGLKGKAPDWERETFDVENPEHRRYARQDTRVLLDSMANFGAAVHSHYGVNIRGTIASTAMCAWQAALSEDEAYWRLGPEQEAAAREAYFGGMAFLTDTLEHEDVVSLDVNSMYPHCMRSRGVPYGPRISPYPTMSWKGDDVPALYLCEFEAPEHIYMGCVPYRDDDGMCFPRGKFVTWAWSIEVARAMRWGYRVRIEEGFWWPELIYPFTGFVNTCEAKRKEHAGEGVEMIFKTMQNSLYGKLGMKPEGMELRVIGVDGPAYKPGDAAALHMEGWQPYMERGGSDSGRSYLWEREVERDANYMMPHWAGWITANARAVLWDAIEAVRSVGGSVVCGDTDSLKLERRWVELVSDRVKIGRAYGEWKLDATYSRFRARSPKNYHYIDQSGTYNGKAKGIPQKLQTEHFHREAFEGRNPEVRWQSSPNLYATLRGKPHATVPRTRVASLLDNSGSWFVDRAGKVRSVSIVDGERVKR